MSRRTRTIQSPIVSTSHGELGSSDWRNFDGPKFFTKAEADGKMARRASEIGKVNPTKTVTNLSDVPKKERVGKKVRMNDACKERWRPASPNHVAEFENEVGIVECLTDFGTSKGPEMDVRWQPNKLRYGYLPSELEVVDE